MDYNVKDMKVLISDCTKNVWHMSEIADGESTDRLKAETRCLWEMK